MRTLIEKWKKKCWFHSINGNCVGVYWRAFQIENCHKIAMTFMIGVDIWHFSYFFRNKACTGWRMNAYQCITCRIFVDSGSICWFTELPKTKYWYYSYDKHSKYGTPCVNISVRFFSIFCFSVSRVIRFAGTFCLQRFSIPWNFDEFIYCVDFVVSMLESIRYVTVP